MPFCPLLNYLQDSAGMRVEPAANIRVLHASPGAPNVDVYANKLLIARNLSYRSFTPYVSVAPGKYNIRVYPVGETITPILSKEITLEGIKIYTAAAVGKPEKLDILPVEDVKVPVSPLHANLRFVNLSPDAPALDVYQPDGRVLFAGVAYKEVSRYIAVPPGMHTFYLRPVGVTESVLYVPNIQLGASKNFSIYAVGLIKGSPALQVLIPLDGSTYI